MRNSFDFMVFGTFFFVSIIKFRIQVHAREPLYSNSAVIACW